LNFEKQFLEESEGPAHQRGESQVPFVQKEPKAPEGFENFDGKYELKTFGKTARIETKRFLIRLLVRGQDGQRMNAFHSRFPEDGSHPEGLGRQKEKYFFMLGMFDHTEERLPLWMTMSYEERLQLIMHQPLDMEAEIMTMMLSEEVEN